MAFAATYPSTGQSSLIDRLKAYWKAAAKRRAARRDYALLVAMTNRDLADMGITREQVRAEALRKTSFYAL